MAGGCPADVPIVRERDGRGASATPANLGAWRPRGAWVHPRHRRRRTTAHLADAAALREAHDGAHDRHVDQRDAHRDSTEDLIVLGRDREAVAAATVDGNNQGGPMDGAQQLDEIIPLIQAVVERHHARPARRPDGRAPSFTVAACSST